MNIMNYLNAKYRNNTSHLLTEACVAQKCDPTVCVAALQQVFSKELSWIMFEYGTLILIPPNDDGTLFTEEQLRTRALELLEKYGKVITDNAKIHEERRINRPHPLT